MELRRISLSRDQTPVFQSLSLVLNEPRVGLIGANGSGKSSLLRLIKGLHTPDSGDILGVESSGIVFQNPEHQLLFPTVMEELCFGLIEQGMPEPSARIQAMSILGRYGAQDLADKATHELSDGQKQLVCILEVLIDGAQCLLLDEPCASLDHAARRAVITLIRALPQQVIMASHDLAMLESFDRVIWLESGAVRQDGPPQAVITAYLSSSNAA